VNVRRGTVTIGIIAALIAILIGLMIAAMLGALGDQWIAVATAAITILGLVLAWWQQQAGRPTPVDSARELARQLTAQVLSDWTAELPNRGLEEHGRRMSLRWRIAEGSNPGAELAAELGSDGTLRQLIDCLRRDVDRGKLPRLVLTGEMGAGKTAACILLIIELVERDLCLPVLFPLATWDSGAPLDVWMARQLPEILGIPGTTGYDQRVAAALVSRHVLPVLDGLEEGRAEPAATAAALKSIDDQLGGRPFVLTCRSEEFADANRGGTLHQATIVELQPLRPDEVRGILLRYEPASVHGPLAPLVAQLEDQPAGPLAEALSTPFMVSLARDADVDLPEPLPGISAPEAAEAFRQTLIGAFIKKAYSRDSRTIPEDAQRYVRFLARHTDKAGRLAWWLLRREVPRAVFLVVNVCIAGPMTAGLGALFFALFDRPWLGFLIGLSTGVIGAFLVELVDQDQPRRAQPKLRSKGVPPPEDLARIVSFGLTGGVPLAVGAWILYSSVTYVVIGGVLAALSYAVGRYLSQPNDPVTALTPDNLLRADRAAVLYAWLAGAASGTLIGAYLGLAFHDGHRPAFDSLGILRYPSPVLALLGAACGCVISGTGLAELAFWSGSWGRFIVTRLWLAWRGSAPLRLMWFLDDAYRRQVLRQANGYYEFRHRSLQRYLAEPSPELSVGASGAGAGWAGPA
jgi:hypothetical protein